MSDLLKLVQHKDDILRAEIAGWLHNIGKLDPNFDPNYQALKQMNEWLDTFKITGYSFRRFTQPKVLESEFPYKALKGVLYFINLVKRQEIEILNNEIKELQGQLDQSPPNRAELGQRLHCFKDQKSRIQKELENAEKQQWRGYEQKIDRLTFATSLFSGWSLGTLLTLFWEGEWFEKPQKNNYKPGSEDDPDYRRKPKKNIRLQPGFSMDFPSLLLLTHGEISGQEKKGMDLEGHYVDVKMKENQDGGRNTLLISTAFGYEEKTLPAWEDWPRQRKEIIDLVFAFWSNPQQGWYDLLKVFQHYLLTALGDTQRPINEISLWDYAQAIAALFKASIAQAVLTGRVPTPGDIRWRLTSIRLDAFDFLFQVNQLVDLIARQKLLHEIWNEVRTALEVETPIGSAVYKDEHGLVFVIPEWPGKSDDEICQIIAARVKDVVKNQAINLIGAIDLRPAVHIGPPQRGKRLLLNEALPAKEPFNMPDPADIQNYWSEHQNQECCHVCGLRPVGYIEGGLPHFVTEKKAKERNLCGICLARRGRRAEEWAEQRKFKETIWVDEVADTNGRMALIVGRFDLDNWLNGKLIRSLAIGTDKKGNWLAKAPTFARLQRVWRTTYKFWQEVKVHVQDHLKDDRRRIQLYLDQLPGLGAYHAYELDLGKTTMSVVWCPAQNHEQGFLISVANLGYIAKQLGEEQGVYKDPAAAAICVEDFIKKEFIQNKRELVLRNPESTGSERRHNLITGKHIVRTDHQDVSYSTAIPILTEPRTFMALVPADKALDVVQDIKMKYESEMGKVRNRLPLHLGVVFAHRRTPFRAILDAGRQMLEQKSLGSHALWMVKSMDRSRLRSGERSDQFNCTVAIELKQDRRSLTWYVPLKMGDGQTDDAWYPYVFWRKDATGQTDPLKAGRKRAFQGLHPDKGRCWLVHADELREGDQVYFATATFDFEWLDTNAQRFEIAYNDCGQRYSCPTRPYLLDDLDRLEVLWSFMKNLTVTQCHQVIRNIEATREAWYGQHADQALYDNVFRQFVADTLARATWPKHAPWVSIQPEWQEKLIQAGVSGELADLAELYMEILKE